MSREKLLKEATSLGLEIHLNSVGKWVIEDLESEKKWLLQEEGLDRWRMSYDEIPPVLLSPESALEVLKILGKLKQAKKQSESEFPKPDQDRN